MLLCTKPWANCVSTLYLMQSSQQLKQQAPGTNEEVWRRAISSPHIPEDVNRKARPELRWLDIWSRCLLFLIVKAQWDLQEKVCDKSFQGEEKDSVLETDICTIILSILYVQIFIYQILGVTHFLSFTQDILWYI